MTDARSKRGRFFCLIFILMGVAAALFGCRLLVESLQCAHWPTTPGVVRKAVMKYQSRNQGGGSYAADVSYAYQVAGVSYHSARIAFGEMSASSDFAQRILSRYPVGKEVLVHYSPKEPEEAVLETGIHGGTWLCLGGGTIFVLAGVMFLQLLTTRVPTQTQTTAEFPASSMAGSRQIALQKPPVLMAVIFVLVGSFVCLLEPERGVPKWVIYAVGGFFVLGGLLLLASRLQNKIYSKILTWAAVLVFLAIFHWISFGPGERIGSSTTPLSHTSGASVKVYFAAFTVFLDAAIIGSLAWRVIKGKKD